MPNQEDPEPMSAEADARTAVDHGSAAEQRLNALAPVDTERLDTAERSIDEAKAAAAELRREQGDDDDGESEG